MGRLLCLMAGLSLSACRDAPPAPPVIEEPAPAPTPEPEPPPAPAPTPVAGDFTNPLRISLADGGRVDNCPDPTILQGQGADTAWYLFCAPAPWNDSDREVSREYRQHLFSTYTSADLVAWTYVGDALTTRPSWANPTSGLRSPELAYFNHKYHLYFTVLETQTGGSAIGVATSDSPAGPWTVSERPVVEPHEAPCCGNSRRWAYDPEVLLAEDGRKYIYYGSFYGGISVRELSADGLVSDPYTQVEVTVANRYEAPLVLQHEGHYYLLAVAANGVCCNGALTGSSVFAGRSKSPMGPFVDREGVRLTLNRVGGTPVLGANGNAWVGTGHPTAFTDMGGQDWIVYPALDRNAPYLAPAPNGDLPPKRPLLMDALDWVDGWPVARGGQGPSDTAQPAPAARAGEKSRYPSAAAAPRDVPGSLLGADEFSGSAVGPEWSWTRGGSASYEVRDGVLRFDTQDADLHENNNSASVLWRPAPAGDFLVETKMSLNLPPVSCCHNYVQAGVLIQSDDDNYVRLMQVSFWETRQIVFAKEVGPAVPARHPRYGETFGGPADETVWLRIVRRARGAEQTYTAYSSRDGVLWSQSATWTHALGTNARVGLVSLGGRGFSARFDYVRLHAVSP
ncbi:family 43 glycosylhydrolase [Melittangium boletus]|uniref:family 43 glycosylhydrolase n=1 Tax=Melittangium boletus TaxID=83453 RepID=UPI003DA1EFE4